MDLPRLTARLRRLAADEAELTNCEPAFEVAVWRGSPEKHHEISAQAVRRWRRPKPPLELIAGDGVVPAGFFEELDVELDNVVVVGVAAGALAELMHGAAEGVEDMLGSHFD
jgi:hypothetical protein